MDIEDQVCSKELAIKLNDAGVNQNSLWHWDLDNDAIRFGKEVTEYGHDIGSFAAAFTVAELGEMLPDGVVSGKHENKAAHKHGKYHCKWFTEKAIYNQRADTEANARAKMLIYCIREILLT